jgi:precorrin-6Y C5,15-methyltransferase (decarboxylating)
VDWRGRAGGTLTRLSIERAGQLGGFTAWRPALPVTQWAARKSARQQEDS